MPYPDFRELSVANVGSNLRPRAATRDLRASLSLGGVAMLSRNSYVGKDAQGVAVLQEPRANHIQRQLGSTGNHIRVFPAVAEFKDTEPNVTHMLTVTVINRSDHVKSIRFVPPKLKQFALHQIPSIPVAPGLEVSADLEYFSTEEGDFADEITVLCEDDRIQVPIYAFAPRAELFFDSCCIFGAVPPSSTNIRYVDMVNRGKKAADFEFIRQDDCAFTIEPVVGRLGQDGSDDCFIRVKVTFKPGDDLGVQRAIVHVKVNDTVLGEALDISALVARQVLELVSPEGSGQLSSLQFGTIYAGETRELSVTIVNDGPEPAQVTSVVHKQDSHEHEDPMWTITPALQPSNALQPFEQRYLNVAYHPPPIPILKGFKTALKLQEHREDHEVAAVFTGNAVTTQEELTASIKLIGRIVVPEVTLSQITPYDGSKLTDFLEFIDTPTNMSTTIAVRIQNHNDELPIVFESQKVPHFRCHPSKGRLLPYQSIDLVIFFAPAQLGMFTQTMQFLLFGSTGQKVGIVDLKTKGACSSEGKKTLVGGLQATDETFKPNFTFQGPDQLQMQKIAPRTKFERVDAWKKFPPEIDMKTVTYTFDAERFDEVKSNGDKYLRWLRGKYDERMAKVTSEEGVDFALGNRTTGVTCGDPQADPNYEKPALDLGLFGLPMKGLPASKTIKEPPLHLPVADEPLYLKHRPGEGPTYIKPKSKPMDENRLMLSKFKSSPTTKKDKQECTCFLNPKQIMQISSYPPKIDYGSVCIQSPFSKNFTVSNSTMQSILVRIDTHGDKALERSTPASQVIPSGATAGFDITLYLESTTTLQTKFTYVINEHHSYEVPITASAVPVMLNMSRDKMSFAFPPSSNSMKVGETLYLINPTNNLAEFKIESNPNFMAVPSFGAAEPMSQEEVQVYYNPGQGTSHEATLKVDVIGGSSMQLNCVGEVDEGQIECKPKSLDFGSVAAGTATKKALTLIAKGSNNNVFFVDKDELHTRCPGLVISPDKGMVPPGGQLQLVAALKANKPVKIDSYFYVQVRGGKSVKVSVKIDVNVPTVNIKTEEIDFGAVYLGGTGIVPVQIENSSNFPAIFTLDLRKYSEFSAKVPDDLEYEDDSEAKMTQNDFLSETVKHGPIVKFLIPPKTEGSIELIYMPETLANNAFELPLTLLGVVGKDAKKLLRAVVAESKKPRLLLSSPSVQFEKRIVVNENIPNFSYVVELTLTNCDDENCLMDARLDGDQVTAGVFKMMDTTADLSPGKSQKLTVQFMPRTDGEFRCKLKVYTDGAFEAPYFDLEVEGVGIYPSLGFDRKEVFLPVTPAGQQSSVVFEVINYGYDNLNLKYTLPVDATSVPMTINFPNGTMLNIVNTRLPVEVTFSATKSMSFATKIEFLDANGNKFALPIIGTTDASILTVFPFLTLHAESAVMKGGERAAYLKMTGPMKAPLLGEEGEIIMESALEQNPNSGKMVNLIPPNSEFLCECKVMTERESVKALLDWANVVIFRQAVVKFPDDLVEARGKQIIDVIEASTGKTVPGQIKRIPANRKDEAQMLLIQYTELLSTLKFHGGLVNAIKPEHLLPLDLFSKLYLEKGGLPVEFRPFYHTHYQLIMEGSWIMLMCQVVKLFVFNRLTPKLLRSTPGVDPALTRELKLTGSNVYSPSELVLLGWLTYHIQGKLPSTQILNFDKDLHDCRVFGAVLASHVPSLSSTMATLRKTDVLSDRIANAQQIFNTCKSLGLEYCPPAAQLVKAPARDMMLFSVYLFNSLPSLIPRAIIDFDGRLNDTVIKNIELTNPSSKPLVYSVRIKGSAEFTCKDCLKIDAKDKIKFPISCFHKVRGDAEAQVFFFGERVAGSTAGVTLVFDLVSSVRTFKRHEVFVKETKLYEQITYEIPVTNLDLDHETIFTVSLVPVLPPPHASRTNSPNKRAGGVGHGKKSHVTSSPLLPEMTFWAKTTSLKVKRKGSNCIKINFVPLQLTGHSCLVFIKDSLAGEMCYELQAKVGLPAQTDSCKFQHQMKSTVVKDVPISTRNPGIDRCRAGLMELMGPAGKDWLKTAFEQPQIDYKVEYLSECFSGPKTFTLWDPKKPKTSPAPGRPQQSMNNKIPIELHPMGPGTYEGKIILRSAFDIRVLDVDATISAQGTRAELTFNCPARQAISQDIPIINHSESEWIIQAALSGQYFSGPKEFKVPAANADGPGKAIYTLTFAPSWISSVQGSLTLRNMTIGDSYIYELSGIAEDPVSEGFHAMECVARKRTRNSILVRNILDSEDAKYTVECDLLGVAGEATFVVPADTEAEYDMSVLMPRGGEFTGSINFKLASGEYIWYTLEVKAENPASEKNINLEAKARTAIVADIPIMNPLGETVTFDVSMEGEGLIGASSITIEPYESSKYELIYSPLLPTTDSEGNAAISEGKLTFFNNQMGEFWYLLFLKADDADEIECQKMEAEIGKTNSIEVSVENPISEDIELEVQISNPLNFRVECPPKAGASYRENIIEVEAYSEVNFKVIYTPTSLDGDEESIIQLCHPIAGNFVYKVKGSGFVQRSDHPPFLGKNVVEMPTVHVSAKCAQASSNMLTFKNPLNRQLMVRLQLTQEEEEGRHKDDQPFHILSSKSQMNLAPFQEVDIPFIFHPIKMVRHWGVIEIEVHEIEQNLLDKTKIFSFAFPIDGTAEAPGTMHLPRISIRAREVLEMPLELPLIGASALATNEKIELEIVPPPEHKQMLSKSLRITRDRQNREGLKEEPPKVRYNVVYEPLKAMHAKVQLRVLLESGGRWVFEVDLVANEAEVDDVIRIEGVVNQKRSVSFTMTNQFDERAPFNAYFTLDSSAEFSVSPEMGILEPYSSSEGTNFVVSFCPLAYGKLFKGKLIVETDQMQWTYEVIGDHPKYQAPNPKNSRAKVDSQIQPELDPDVYKGRNAPHKYLRENVADLKQQQQKNRLRTAQSGAA